MYISMCEKLVINRKGINHKIDSHRSRLCKPLIGCLLLGSKNVAMAEPRNSTNYTADGWYTAEWHVLFCWLLFCLLTCSSYAQFTVCCGWTLLLLLSLSSSVTLCLKWCWTAFRLLSDAHMCQLLVFTCWLYKAVYATLSTLNASVLSVKINS